MPQLFDLHAKIGVRIPGREPVLCRFPSDEEWAAYCRRVTLQESGGSIVQSPQNASEIVELAALLTGERLEQDVADWLIGRLTHCEPASSLEGGSLVTHAQVFAGIVTYHEHRPPTLQQLREFFAEHRGRAPGGGVYYNVEYIGEWYDRHVKRTDGYAGKVPLFHRQIVAMAMAVELDRVSRSTELDFFVTAGGRNSTTSGSSPTTPSGKRKAKTTSASGRRARRGGTDSAATSAV